MAMRLSIHPQEDPCYRLSRPQRHSAAGRIRSIESNGFILNRTRYLPACSTVPQPTLQCNPHIYQLLLLLLLLVVVVVVVVVVVIFLSLVVSCNWCLTVVKLYN
jgi:hypothetical protein